MDLQLTRRGEYAVRTAIALAQPRPEGEYLKLREISADMAIPLRYTQEILTLLMRAGLVEGRAGKQGGYRLLRQPQAISLLEVVEAAEGPLRSDRCTMSGSPCHWHDSVCAVHEAWQEANAALTKALHAQALARVTAADTRLRSGSP